MSDYPEEMFASFPTVCAVGEEYQIMIPVRKESLMWCEVGGREFFDHSNGILRSAVQVHRICIPQKVLNAAKEYTVCYREIFERLPYRSRVSDVQKVRFSFRPVDDRAEKIRLYHVADTHSTIEEPVRTASFWGDSLDLLILNGDIPNDCGSVENIASAYQVSGRITKGEIPMVFSRGNHDLRGVLAEKYAENTPSRNGRTYYTFRLGPLWGIVLDCGEDKVDENVEYGHTICCHEFRLGETEFLKEVAASGEFNAPGILYRIVIVHNPFPQTMEPPFDIEQELYREWCRILRESVKPDVMLCGHMHRSYIIHPGDEKDHKGTPCPVVVASEINKEICHFAGAALEWTPAGMRVLFTDQDGKISGEEFLPRR